MCSLELFNTTRENVIIVGKLSDEIDYNTLSPMESLSREKQECVDLLETVSERINSRNADFASHLLLSIFKMAEVEIVQVEPSSSSDKFYTNLILVVGCCLFSSVPHLLFLTPSWHERLHYWIGTIHTYISFET